MSEGLAVNLKLNGRNVVVFGGGAVAARKIPLLLRAEAIVHVISPTICDSIKRLAKKHVVHWISKSAEQFLKQPDAFWHHAILVVMTTDDYHTHDIIREHAMHIPLQLDAGRADQGNVSLPALWQTEGLTVAFSTNGISPGLAKMAREQWTEWFTQFYGNRFGCYTRIVEMLRKQFKHHVEDAQLRQSLNRVLTDPNQFLDFQLACAHLDDPQDIVDQMMRSFMIEMGLDHEITIEKSAHTEVQEREENEVHANDQSRNEIEFVSSNANGTNN